MVVRTVAFVIVRRVLRLVGLSPAPDVKDVEIAVLRHQLMVGEVSRPAALRAHPSDGFGLKDATSRIKTLVGRAACSVAASRMTGRALQGAKSPTCGRDGPVGVDGTPQRRLRPRLPGVRIDRIHPRPVRGLHLLTVDDVPEEIHLS
jgi:hypothetical protein